MDILKKFDDTAQADEIGKKSTRAKITKQSFILNIAILLSGGRVNSLNQIKWVLLIISIIFILTAIFIFWVGSPHSIDVTKIYPPAISK